MQCTHLLPEIRLGDSDEFCLGVLVPDSLEADEATELRPLYLSCDASARVVLGLAKNNKN